MLPFQPAIAGEIEAALAQMAASSACAADVGMDAWQFAVSLRGFAALGVTESTLRWLVARGYAEHGYETTAPDSAERRFQPSRGLLLSEKSCFVLSEAGAKFAATVGCVECTKGVGCAERATDQAVRFTPTLAATTHCALSPPPPEWDAARHVLRVGGRIVKHFRQRSPNQETILTTFQLEGWPPRIDDPLPPRGEVSIKERLHFTIKRLNLHQRERLLRFSGDGTGEGVCWEHYTAAVATTGARRADRKFRRAA